MNAILAGKSPIEIARICFDEMKYNDFNPYDEYIVCADYGFTSFSDLYEDNCPDEIRLKC